MKTEIEIIRIDCPSKAHEYTYYIECTGSTRHERIDAACTALKGYLGQHTRHNGERMPHNYRILEPGEMDGFDRFPIYEEDGVQEVKEEEVQEEVQEEVKEVEVKEVKEVKTEVKTDDKAGALLSLIADIAGDSVNERRVIELIKEYGGVSTTHIEVSDATGPLGEIEGLVHEKFDLVLKCVSRGMNVALIGPTGSGKSILARQVAEALGRFFSKTGQVIAPHDIMGYMRADGTYQSTPCREAIDAGGVHLFDEMDSYSPRALLAANGLVDSSSIGYFPDAPGGIDISDTVFVAALNTWGLGATSEYTGRAVLDASTMRRFTQIEIGYDAAIEEALAGEHVEWLQMVREVRAGVEAQGISGHPVATSHLVDGITLMAGDDGLTLDDAASLVLRRELSDMQWDSVK